MYKRKKKEREEEKTITADVVVDKDNKEYLLVRSCFVLIEEKEKHYLFQLINSSDLHKYRKIGTKEIPEFYIAAIMSSC